MITIVAKSNVTDKTRESVLEIFEKLIQETVKEEGCIEYKLHVDIDDQNILTLIEKWETMEHIDKHFNTPHFKELVPELQELRESGDLNIYKDA